VSAVFALGGVDPGGHTDLPRTRPVVTSAKLPRPGVVVSGEYEQSQPTLLDLGKPSPDAIFTAVIDGMAF